MKEKQLYGIAFTRDGSTSAPVMGWKRDRETGEVLTWEDYAEALEAFDLSGWTGYVRIYPSGEILSFLRHNVA